MVRICQMCGEMRPWESYNKDKSKTLGVTGFCKPCIKARGAERRLGIESKTCETCELRKLVKFFSNMNTNVDGFMNHCKRCELKRARVMKRRRKLRMEAFDGRL